MIDVDSLTKRFADTTALAGVSFSARRGEILGVLGPNGAGKTTTLRILCGYLPPTSGRASVDGIDVVRSSLDVRRRIGYLPEDNPLYPEMRVTEYLRFRAGLKAVPRHDRARRMADVVERCGLNGVARKTIGTLSKGFRQRVGLADALIHEPPVLVLDEPTSGLDPNQVVEVRHLIRSLRGKHTILLSSHILSEVEQICDRVVIFREGHVIAEDSTDSLRQRMSSRTNVVVELRERDAERLAELVGDDGEIVEREQLDDGWLRVRLAADHDPREAIYERAVQLSITLRELSRRVPSLERIFRELTSDEPPAPSGAEDA